MCVIIFWAKAGETMLFSKCSSFLYSSGGDYNFMGNLFAQFPISHKFSFTSFCVFVIWFFFVFFYYHFCAWGKYRQVFLSFSLFHLFYYFLNLTVYLERDEELSRFWNGECDLHWPQNCYVSGPDSCKRERVCACVQTICMSMLNECFDVDISGATVGSFSEVVRKRDHNSVTAITVVTVMISMWCTRHDGSNDWPIYDYRKLLVPPTKLGKRGLLVFCKVCTY